MKLLSYFKECFLELRKATWPWDPKEKGFKRFKALSDSTVVVVVAILLLGAYVAFFDIILRFFIEFVTNVGNAA